MKNLRGREISLAEVEESLGPQTTWGQRDEWLEAWETQKRPTVSLASADAGHLKFHPPYVTHCLLRCARRVLEAPRAVFVATRPDSTTRILAFCGLPASTYDNEGNALPPPERMVFVVYVRDGNVFDWDWVEADPNEPAFPVGYAVRFAERLANPRSHTIEGLVSLPRNQFAPTRAIRSTAGDCVFAYFRNEPSYAERVDERITLFRSLADREVVGCKIKDINGILNYLKTHEDWHAPLSALSVRVVLLHSATRLALRAETIADHRAQAHARTVAKAVDELLPHMRDTRFPLHQEDCAAEGA